VAAIVTLAFAGPAVAGSQTGPYIGTMPTAGSATATQTNSQAGQTFVPTTVYVGTSAISGSCVLTTSDDIFWSYNCPGGGTAVGSSTTAQGVSKATAASCTLADFWTYGCSDGKAGVSKGAIPKSGTSRRVKAKAASSKARAGAAADTPRGCAGTVSDRRLSGLLCIL